MLIFMKTDKTFKILLIEDNLGDIRLTQEAFKESLVPCTLHAIDVYKRQATNYSSQITSIV